MPRSLLVLAVAVLASLDLVAPVTPAAQETGWPRRVLLTNDDGIEDPGLLALARAFAPIAETYVVAPLENRSGSGDYVSAIASRRLTVVRKDLGAGVTAYGVDGYPADAVVLALTGLLADRPPDLVISGVNSGPNLSDDAYLSGTVGAARVAALLGLPAIAVSGHNGEPETLAAIARWVVELARSPVVRGLGPRGFLTVSVPRVTAAEIAGVEVVRRGRSPWRFRFKRGPATEGSEAETWQLRFERIPVTPDEGTDLDAYRRNRIAIVPMRADEHDDALLETLRAGGSELPHWPVPARNR
jgi:5'-nucleotidase